MRRIVVLMMLLATLGVACERGDPMGHGDADHDASTAENAGFGEPGNADEVDRTIEVTALDTPAFEPTSISVAEGETVNFLVTNEGQARHEFVIGDEDYQRQHEQGMHGAAHPMEDGNVVELKPGQTEGLVWTFTAPGETLFACHVDGHYDAGMVGTIIVEG